MNLSKIISRRAAILSVVLLAFASVVSADTVYNVSGDFGTICIPFSSVCYSSTVFNDGTFSGTFSANLPISANVSESISTFNISQSNSSGAVLDTLSNVAGGLAYVASYPDCGDAANLGSLQITNVPGPCDVFFFEDHGGDAILVLVTPAGFTGGNVDTFPSSPSSAANDVPAPNGNTLSYVSYGTIDPAPTPEAGMFILLGMALLAGLWVGRKRLLA